MSPSPAADAPSNNALYGLRAPILHRTPFYRRAAVLIRLMIDAASESSRCTTTGPPELCVLSTSAPCLSA
jgi:hypothetical protein